MVRRVARRSIEQWGATTYFDVAAKVSRMGGEGIEAAVVLDLLMLLVNFEWLDEETGWFWLRSVPRNRLLNQLEEFNLEDVQLVPDDYEPTLAELRIHLTGSAGVERSLIDRLQSGMRTAELIETIFSIQEIIAPPTLPPGTLLEEIEP